VAEERLDPGLWETLDRQPREPARAHQAFLDYVRLGAGRSLRQLHAVYVKRASSKPQADSPPTTRLSTLFTWSARHAWQPRLAAYREERQKADQAVWEQRRAAVREADWQAGEALRDLAAQVLAQTPQFVKTARRLVKGGKGVPDREVITLALDGTFLLKTLDLASALQRQAAEVLPATQRHEHSGAGGGPIQHSQVTIYLPDNGRTPVPDDGTTPEPVDEVPGQADDTSDNA
jgi:hypothetical protein